MKDDTNHVLNAAENKRQDNYDIHVASYCVTIDSWWSQKRQRRSQGQRLERFSTTHEREAADFRPDYGNADKLYEAQFG